MAYNGSFITKHMTPGKHYYVDEFGHMTSEVLSSNIAPVKNTSTSNTKKKKKKWNEGYLQAGAFQDGYDFGDITKTIISSQSDIIKNVSAGVVGAGEKAIDLGAYVAGGIGGLLGADRFKEKTSEFIQKDIIDEKKVAENILMVTNPATRLNKLMGDSNNDNSVFGDKIDSLAQSGGELALTGALQSIGVPWYLTTGASAFGGQVETALKEGATYEQAGGSALISAGSEIILEKLSGGIKFGGGKKSGIFKKIAESGKLGSKTLELMQKLDGKTLDDLLLRPLTEKISNKLLQKSVNLGLDAAGEGLEEALSSMASRAGTSLYKEESWEELLWSEEAMDEYIDSLVGGAIMGGASGTIKTFSKSNLTENEQKVVDKEVENRIKEAEEKGKTIWAKDKDKIYNEVLNDLQKGYISTDTIESVLGDKTYETYKTMEEQENALKKEIESLENTPKEQFTVKQDERLKELREELAKIDKTQVKNQLSSEVSELAKVDRLSESYNEKARRSEAFKADLSKYDTKQQEVIKRATESGILNNTNRTHEFVDMVAKISADIGVLFDFTNNQKLKDSGFAIEGKTVNGYVKDGNIAVNIDSNKSLNTIVGHEITHVLEGTELYTELQEAVKQYATTKGDYDTRIKELSELYKDVKDANIEGEVTADLVGDYLFTDKDFVNNLSVEKPNIFKKIFNEIKYLYKMATAGSKEARQLEKLKRTFEKAYKESFNATREISKYSISKDIDGNSFVKVTEDIFKENPGESVARVIQKVIAEKFDNVVKVNGQQIKINKTTNDEFRKSKSAYGVKNESLQKFDDKLRTFANADEILKVAKDWIGEEKKHIRKDNIIEFARGNVAYKIDDNGYEADVIVAIQKNGSAVLYDLINIYEKKIVEKSIAKGNNKYSLRREDFSTDDNITQSKNVVNKKNIKYSLSESNSNSLSEDEKIAHIKTAQEYFGLTENWNEVGYITLDGNKLDFSGRHEGGPGGQRDVDHRDIRDALGDDYGGKDFSGSLVQFMSEGNIRVMPESNGINLSVMPTKEQMQTLEEFITMNNGEITLDIDDASGKTVFSMDYPSETSSDKIFKDIETHLKPNGDNYISPYSQFRHSLSEQKQGTAPYGNYNVYGKDIALENDTVEENNIAPIKEDNNIKTADNSLNTKDNKSTNEFNPYAKEVSEDGIETVSSDELRESKIENAQIEVDNLIQHRETSYKSYSDKIEQLQQEYDAKKNKDTKVANTLLQRIERLKRSREDTDTKYKKDIGDRQNKLELIKKGHPTKRSEVQGKIIDDIKIELNKNNVDLDDALLNGKNLSAIKINDNTPQRVFEKTFEPKVGRLLSDLTVNKVARNETEAIKWLNKYTNRKDGVLKELSDKYKIKPGSKESAAAQMYAEGFYVDRHNKIVKYGDAELAKDFPDFEVRNRIIGLAKNPMIRQIYDETLDMINESRQRNGYPAIPKLENYYLHFRAMEDTFSKLGLPFNPNSIKAKDLPTDLNGVTADLQPGQPYFASSNHRKGKRTTFDLLGGLEMYLSGAKNQIYHIDDIQTFRALRNYIADMFGQAKGLENLDELEDNQIEEMIEKIYGSHLSNFARFLNEEANVIAGKTALIDRGLEGALGRKGVTFLNDLNSQVGSHMVGGNISSSLTNFLVLTDAFSKSNKADFFKAFTQMASNKVNSLKGKSDGFVENNPTMIRRNGAETFNRTVFQRVSDAGYVLMGIVDNISTELVTRTKYNECIRKGMTSEQAMNEADKWASRMMGDRSLGQQPLLYNSKTFGMFTKFQLEVRNFLDSALYDNIQDAKLENEDIKNGIARNAKIATKVTSTLIQLAIGQHLFGKAFEKMAGYNPAFDVIETIIKTFGLDDDEESEDTVEDNIEQGLMSLLEDLPYSSLITNGGRVPVTSALPFAEVFNKDNFSNKSLLERTGDAIKEVAPYYLLPTGYGQIKKTMKGLEMFDEDLPLPGSYTESGKLRFTVEDTPANRIKAGLFGQWANENAREYFDSGSAPLNSKQIQELKDLDIPIKDYRKYKKDISSNKKISDKADYINELDLPIDKKNILVNNAVNRKKEMDMTNYNDFSNFEEFDFHNKNPKKYEFLQENNISYEDYKNDKETKKTYDWAFKNPKKYEFLKSIDVSLEKYNKNENTKEAYDWAYNNPDKYTLSKAISKDVVKYKKYTKEISAIRGDKYPNGRTVSGSRKQKVLDYINNLDADYGEKLILYKSEYEADDTYNYDIVDYLNSRQDIDYDEMNTILKQLGFRVTSDGTIYWN